MTDRERTSGRRQRADGGSTAPGRSAWATLGRYEADGRWRGVAALTGLLGVSVVAFLAFFPSMTAADVDLDAYVEAFPPAFREIFGVVTISTIEGFLAVEFYQFAWLILLGLYLAYLGGESVAQDVESGLMDLTLAAPMRRRDVVVGKFLGLVPLVLVLNAALPVVAYAGVLAIGETIAVERLLVVHALAVPYHLTCVAIGVAVSVAVDRVRRAQRVALGVVFALFMFESLTAVTEYDRLGVVSPTAHYAPSEVLVHAEYDWIGGATLLAATAVLIGIAVAVFRRRDVRG